jgi:hypothetical protein
VKLAIATEDEEHRQFITEELERIKARDVEKDGKLKIVSKDEITEHLGRRSDFADMLAVRLWLELDKSPEPGVRKL